MNLFEAYRYNRTRNMIRIGRNGGTLPLKATAALKAARDDMAAHKAAKAHYETAAKIRDESPTPENATAYQTALKALSKTRRYMPEKVYVTYQQDKPGFACISDPAAVGLRLVGRVMADTPRGMIWGDKDSGWYTDPHGDTFRDGSGLCYGVVYQLPGHKGQARFVAGYEFGGIDGGPTIDLGTVYTSASNAYEDHSYEGPQGNDDARDAARAADSMAQQAAEKEREYQTGWALGNLYAEKAEAVKEARKEALELLKERRVVLAQFHASGPMSCNAICKAIRGQVESLLDTIKEARDDMRKALNGDGPGLCVYMGEDEKTAFCEAAGLASFPHD